MRPKTLIGNPPFNTTRNVWPQPTDCKFSIADCIISGSLPSARVRHGPEASWKATPNLIGNYSESLATGGISFPGAPGGGDPDGYLVAGNYTFNNGAGGPDVGAFNASFTLPANINWTNKASTTVVNRAQGLTVNWTGGDPSGYVQIYGYSLSEVAENAVAGFFTCLERASVGTFNVPAAILLALPPSPTGGPTDLVPTGILGVGGVSSPRTFTAPGIDTGTIVSTAIITKSVNYQ